MPDELRRLNRYESIDLEHEAKIAKVIYERYPAREWEEMGALEREMFVLEEAYLLGATENEAQGIASEVADLLRANAMLVEPIESAPAVDEMARLRRPGGVDLRPSPGAKGRMYAPTTPREEGP